MAEEIRQRFAAALDGLVAEVPAVADLAAGWAAVENADAAACYWEIRDALDEIALFATELDDDRIWRWLTADATTALVVAAAAAVLEADGLVVDRGTDAAAQLRRARHWCRYSRSTVDDLHRSCARDVSRGSLRLLSRAGGRPVDTRLELQRTRLALVRSVRRQFGDLSAELHALVPSGRRAAAGFEDIGRRRLAELSASVRATTAAALGPVEPVGPGRWRPNIPRTVLVQRRDEIWLGGVLGAGFGLGSGLGLARICTGAVGLPPAAGGALGLVTALALAFAVITIRARQHRRMVLERWLGSAVAAARQAAEEELAYRLLEAQTAPARTSQIDKLRDSEKWIDPAGPATRR